MRAQEKLVICIFTCILIMIGCSSSDKTNSTKYTFEAIEKQLEGMVKTLGDSQLNPRCSNNDASLRTVPSKDWTSGFFPGVLWMQYEYTGDTKWKQLAEKYTKNIEDQQYNNTTHDMGFKMYCSYGNGFRLTNNPNYKKVLLQSANTLMTRYNPQVGCLRSWDHNNDKWEFPVIIDNMMNLELLFWASRVSRDSTYYNAAYQHALSTLKNHFRPDYSSYHVVDYDPQSGNVRQKNTHQGTNDESAWSRGQAWGLYGFTMAYRETGDKQFLQQACKIADFVMSHPHLPQDGIPYWDFDDTQIPNAPRDASAAAIIASGLYEMCLYLENETTKLSYKTYADKIITSLSSPKYLAKEGKNNHFILMHSTGNLPKNDEIDKPIIYADYYFLEALLRKVKYEGNNNISKPKIVLKLDDVRFDKNNTLSPRWTKVFKYAIDNKIKVNAGIITNSLEHGNAAYIDMLRQYQDSEYIEFWNHGFDHKRYDKDGMSTYEFKGSGYEHQFQHLKKGQELSKDKLGRTFTTFGAPYNQTDEDTEKALNQFPEIKNWLYATERYQSNTSRTILRHIPALNIEYPTHHPSFYHLWNSLLLFDKENIVTLQGHPVSWDEKRFLQFEMMLDYLRNSNYEFILCSDVKT